MGYENQESQIAQPKGENLTSLAGDLLSSHSDFKAFAMTALANNSIPKDFGKLELIFNAVEDITADTKQDDSDDRPTYCGTDGGVSAGGSRMAPKDAEKPRSEEPAQMTGGFADQVARVIQESDGQCYLDSNGDGYPDDRRAPDGIGSEDTVPCSES